MSKTIYIIVIVILSILTISFLIAFIMKPTTNETIITPEPITPDPITPVSTLREHVEHWVLNNNTQSQNIKVPKSYDVPADYFSSIPEYTQAAFDVANDEERYDRHIAMYNQQYGTSTYDCAVHVTCVAKAIKHNNEQEWLYNAYKFFKYLAYGIELPTESEAGSLIGVKPNPIIWKYFQTDQEWNAGATGTARIGTIGYHFRNIPLGGWLVDNDPLPCAIMNGSIGGAPPPTLTYDVRLDDAHKGNCQYEGMYTHVETLFTTWSDYRPVSGENMWCLLAACQLRPKLTDTAQINDIEFFAIRLAKTALALETVPGSSGILFYSPQNYVNGSIPKDGEEGYAGWNVLQYSIENMASAAAALNAFATSQFSNFSAKAIQKDVGDFAMRIAVRIRDAHIHPSFDYSNNEGGTKTISTPSINQGGAVDPPGADFGKNPTQGTQLATDCTTWAISIFGKMFDAKTPGICFELWQTIKAQTSWHDKNGDFGGFGYSFNEKPNVLSAEWTIGAMFAAQTMIDFLYKDDVDKATSLRKDVEAMEKAMLTQITYDVAVGGASLYYANKKNYKIIFGWIAQRNGALASTGWYLLWLDKINPWRLDGSMNFVF